MSDAFLQYICFDVVYRSGSGLLHKPLAARVSLLATLGVPQVWRTLAASRAEIISDIEAVVATPKEGVVLKRAASHSISGARGTEWLKVKRDFLKTRNPFGYLDMAVIGASCGRGVLRDTGYLSAFPCAVRLGKGEMPEACPRVSDMDRNMVFLLLLWGILWLFYPGKSAARSSHPPLLDTMQPDLAI
jgi:ATP-dependent DNA ligase